ncbi:MAG: LysR family transcriptional regulator, partial [Rubrimonas sp.]
MLDLNDLRLFVHIVEHRGILRAGRALRLPKSTISRRLAALEDQLKARLVVRSGDDFALTAAGETAYAMGRAMVDAAEAAEDRLLARGAEAPTLATLAVSALLQDCAAQVAAALADSPGMRLAVEIGDPAGAPGDNHDLHLRAHLGPLPDSALIQRRIGRSPMILAAVPGLIDGAETPEAALARGLLAYAPGAPPTSWTFTGPGGETRAVTAAPLLSSA